MEKIAVHVPTLSDADFKAILPPSMLHRGLDQLFGHFASSYLKQIANKMNSYTWFRFVEQESKNVILKRMAVRALYRMLADQHSERICAANENAYIYAKKAVGISTRGVNYKPVNEDGFGIFEREGELLLVTCDGVGDCLVGEVASLVILGLFEKEPTLTAAEVFSKSVEVLAHLGEQLEQEIPEFFTFPNEISQAAVTSVSIKEDQCEVGQVGDVLLYLVRDNKIQMLDQNRNWLTLTQLNRLFSDETYLSQRHIISNAVGRNYDAYWAPTFLTLQKDDLLILASDGLETLHPQDILSIANRKKPLKTLLDDLYSRAIDANLKWNTLGSPIYTKPDNITVVLYRHE